MPDKRLTFLIVEDNELDMEKIERSLAKLDIRNPVVRAFDGIEALDILRGENGAEQIQPPFVVLLDLNMPRMNGIELLAEIRADRTLAPTPVFVLTTSDRSADVERAFQYNVAGYIVKPLDRSAMTEVLEKLEAFWEITLFPDLAGPRR